MQQGSSRGCSIENATLGTFISISCPDNPGVNVLVETICTIDIARENALSFYCSGHLPRLASSCSRLGAFDSRCFHSMDLLSTWSRPSSWASSSKHLSRVETPRRVERGCATKKYRFAQAIRAGRQSWSQTCVSIKPRSLAARI